jgi:hypothetical protein
MVDDIFPLCAFCGGSCNLIAGNPGEWALYFTHPDGTGIAYAHHVKCVQDRLFPRPTDAATEQQP